MSYPPSVLAVNRTDSTSQQTTHPADHNTVNQAVNDIVAELGPAPHGGSATVQARIAAIETATATTGCKWVTTQTFAGSGGGAVTTVQPATAGDVTVNTGGWMDTPTSAFMRVPAGPVSVYGAFFRISFASVWSGNVQVWIQESGQGYIGFAHVPANQSVASVTVLTTLNPSSALSFQVSNFGAAFTANVIANCFRIS